jgi:hypothetical protein
MKDVMLSRAMTTRLISLKDATLERLVAALVDPARREWVMAGILAVYTVLWAVYGVIAKGGQGLHYDMVEQVSLAREPELGYARHPPAASLIVRAWFSVFPLNEASYYLLAITAAAVALWIAWRLAGDYLEGEKRVVALALLTLVPFYNFHALKYNANTVLTPLWAVTTLWFLRSFERRSALYAALAGLGAAGAMLGKYWSVFLLAGLGLAALLDSRRTAYVRSPAPWITIGVGALVIAPHLVWLYQYNFAPFEFAVSAHGERTFLQALKGAAGYLGGGAGYVAVPVVLALALARPSRAALRDILFPATPERRFAAMAFWAPLLLPAAVAPLFGVELVSIWTICCFTLLPVLLLSSPLLVLSHAAVLRIVGTAIAFPIIMVLLSPLIARVIQEQGVNPVGAHAQPLTQAVDRIWHETTERPLRLVGGQPDLAFGVAFYAPDRPSAFPDLDRGLAPWATPERIARDGIALVCAVADRGCVALIEKLAAGSPNGRRSEVTLDARRFAPSARYLIITVPPTASDKN